MALNEANIAGMMKLAAKFNMLTTKAQQMLVLARFYSYKQMSISELVKLESFYLIDSKLK